MAILFKRFFIFLNVIALIGCSSNIRRKSDNQETNMTVDDEIKMTAEVLPQMQKDYPAHSDQKLQEYLRRVGEKLVRANNLQGNPYQYTFTVVDVNYINAFALPAGTVFVTAPLMAMAESEAELAGVIGHEIAHITNRHTAKRMYAQKNGQSKGLLYAAGGVLVGVGTGFGIGKLLCKKNDKQCLAKATVAGGALGGVSGILVHRYEFMQNSQRDEMEADRDGFNYAVKAGYSKDHIGLFYKKLESMQNSSQKGSNPFAKWFADALSTHPPSKERVSQIDGMARVTIQPGKPIVTTTAFNDARARAQIALQQQK